MGRRTSQRTLRRSPMVHSTPAKTARARLRPGRPRTRSPSWRSGPRDETSACRGFSSSIDNRPPPRTPASSGSAVGRPAHDTHALVALWDPPPGDVQAPASRTGPSTPDEEALVGAPADAGAPPAPTADGRTGGAAGAGAGAPRGG